MATELTISLNAEQYRSELQKVIRETREASSTINSLSGDGVSSSISVEVDTSQLSEAEKKIDALPKSKKVDVSVKAKTAPLSKTASELKKVGTAADGAQKKVGLFGRIQSWLTKQNAAENIGKGAAAIGAVGTAAAASTPAVGAMAGVTGALAAAVNAALAPLALIMAALSAVAAIGAAVWDKLTVSAEEFSASADAAAEHSQAILDKIKEQDAAAENYVNRLKELNDAEKLTNAAKNEMATLLKTLEGYYGDLGAEIDKTTGKIQNMKEVQEQLEKKRADRQARAAENVVNDLKDQALSRYMKARGDDYGTTEGGAREEFENAAKTRNTAKMIEWVKKRLNDSQNNADQRSTYGEAVTFLREALEKEKEIQMLREYGVATEDELLKKQQQQTAAAAEAENKRQQALNAQYEQVKKIREAMSPPESKNADDIEERLKVVRYNLNRQKKIYDERGNGDIWRPRREEKIAEYELELAKLESELQAVDTIINGQQSKLLQNAANERDGNVLSHLGDGDFYAAAEAKVASAKKNGELDPRLRAKDEARLVRELAQAYEDVAAAKKQKDEEDRYAKAHDLLESAGEQLELQRALAAGDQDRIAALKLEAELKAKNLELTGEELKKLKEIRAQQGSQQLYGGMLEQAYAMRGRLREQSGDGKMFATDKALLDAEKRKGGSLTDDESRLVRDLAGLDYEIQHAAAFKLSGGIQTNALTQRGGFASGALAPDKDKINKEISANTKKIATMLDRVSDLQKEIRDKLGT